MSSRPGPAPKSIKLRIIENSTVIESGCWIWKKRVGKNGYGRITIPKENDYGLPASSSVHRASYTAFVGPIPDGLVIDHICRNRSCCNPRHLEPVSHRENLLRGNTNASINKAKTHCFKCGGQYTHKTWESGRSERVCIPCRKEYTRDYGMNKRGSK